ncbi:YxlC family protein [Ectobacillus polymachus]|uniref:YxlC family protein n=1 Tax=Ectobacillus polymachus TaxID=1508806 RepID=UPI003A863D0D
MMNEQNHSLRTELQKLDQIPTRNVTIEEIMMNMSEQEQRQKAKLRNDILIFLLVASVLLTGLIVSLLKMSIVFIALQFIVFVFLPLLTYFDKQYSKRINWWEER